MRAMTLGGMCVYLNIAFQTWANYRSNSDFLDVTERIESIIYLQKFEGAAADMLNANIISRELGLNDANKHIIEQPKENTAGNVKTVMEVMQLEQKQRIERLKELARYKIQLKKGEVD